jgi:hypothetical protein
VTGMLLSELKLHPHIKTVAISLWRQSPEATHRRFADRAAPKDETEVTHEDSFVVAYSVL